MSSLYYVLSFGLANNSQQYVSIGVRESLPGLYRQHVTTPAA